jgi:hypothetical protein
MTATIAEIWQRIADQVTAGSPPPIDLNIYESHHGVNLRWTTAVEAGEFAKALGATQERESVTDKDIRVHSWFRPTGADGWSWTFTAYEPVEVSA